MPDLESSQAAQMRRQLQEQTNEIAALKVCVWSFQPSYHLLPCCRYFTGAPHSSWGSSDHVEVMAGTVYTKGLDARTSVATTLLLHDHHEPRAGYMTWGLSTWMCKVCLLYEPEQGEVVTPGFHCAGASAPASEHAAIGFQETGSSCSCCIRLAASPKPYQGS